MRHFFKNDCGATVVEFALVVSVFFTLVLGVIQFSYAIWIDNLLHYSVNAAARCMAVGSTSPPCSNPSANTAHDIFTSMAGSVAGVPTFTANCPVGSGYTGAYTVTFLYLVNLRFSAQSCYPTLG
jgi:Flp pilus assembly protein TadG